MELIDHFFLAGCLDSVTCTYLKCVVPLVCDRLVIEWFRVSPLSLNFTLSLSSYLFPPPTLVTQMVKNLPVIQETAWFDSWVRKVA